MGWSMAAANRRRSSGARCLLAGALLVGGCSFDRAGIQAGVALDGAAARVDGRRATDAASQMLPPDRPGVVDGGAEAAPPPADAAAPDAPAPPDAPPDRPTDRPPDRPPDLPDAPPPPVAIRINVNGPAHIGLDLRGAWAADPGVGGVCGPSVYANHVPIAATQDDELFQDEVYGNPLTCAVGGGKLPPGPYQLNLYFAEIYFGPGCPGGGGAGARVFDIIVEGERRLVGFDIFREGGCAASPSGRPVIKRFSTRIDDGTLDLRFEASVNNAKIAAIELLSAW